MSFDPKFTITNRMTQAITRIERARAVTPLSSYTSSLLRAQRRGIQG
jgi:hypothetical protein